MRLTRTVTVDGTPDAIAAWRAEGYRTWTGKLDAKVVMPVSIGGKTQFVDVVVTEKVEDGGGVADATGVPV